MMSLTRIIRVTSLGMIAALLGNSLAFAAKKATDPAAIKAKLQARGVGAASTSDTCDKTEEKGTMVAVGEQSFALKAKLCSAERD